MLFLFIATPIIAFAATFVDGINTSHAVAAKAAAVMALRGDLEKAAP